jgi:hypothetical protein
MLQMMNNRRKWQGLAIAFLSALLSVSCGGGKTAAPASASLELNNSSLDFGNVSVGSTKTKSITLTNSSTDSSLSITVSQVTITGSAFKLKNAATPFTLAAGQSSNITVVFAPKAGGSADGSLSIMVDGAADAAVASLAGSGVASDQLAVSPAKLTFGNVAVGDQKSLAGTLTAGDTNVNISTADWSGSGYTLSGITFPATVAAGKSVSFTVSFSPQAAGSASGSVSFVSDASNSPAQVTFSGSGTQGQTGSGHSVDLSWQASTSTVVGYNVYRATKSGGPYTRVNAAAQTSTSYTDNSVQSGATYYYVATSLSNNAAESDYSSEVTAVIPSP